MGLPDLLNHLANFAAPALWMAVVITLLARVLMKKVASARALPMQAAINFAVCLAVLIAGLWWWGRDGKMVTYGAMALACASSQWAMLRSGKA